MKTGHQGKSSLFLNISQELKKRIAQGTYHSQNPFPREADFCREFSVSRVTIRKALEILKKEGLVASRKRSGTVVTHRGGKRTNLVGIVVPNSWQSLYAGITHALERQLAGAHMDLILRNGAHDPALERKGIESILKRNADALIFIWDKNSRINLAYLKHAAKKIPTMIVDAFIPDLNADFFSNDHRQGGYLATEHLILSGARRLLHIRGTPGVWTADQRHEGFQDACRRYSKQITEKAVIAADFDAESAAKVFSRFLKENKNPPDGVFASSDMMAWAAENLLASMGLKCPDDVRIIGFGNDYGTQREAYGISTVDQHPELLGQAIAKKLLRRIYDPPGLSSKKNQDLLPVSLVVRRSSSSAPRSVLKIV